MKNEYYGGENGLAHYLDPTNGSFVPLVEISSELNPYLKSHGIHISAKLMNTLALANVKSLPAWNMLANTQDVSQKTFVEASSGNTVFSLGLLARHFGIKGVEAIASPDVSSGKLALLRLANIKVRMIEGPICPDPNDPDGAIVLAKQEGDKEGFYNLGQYHNDANPGAHEVITGPQIYTQLNGQIDLLCAGLGTTGTLLGTARYLKKKIPKLKVLGITRTPNNPVPGVRTKNGLREVAFDWQRVVTEPLVHIGEKKSYEASLQLIRSGLLVGPSAGFAYAGLLEYLNILKENGKLNNWRGKQIVFICPDSPFPYVADYERILDSGLFPKIEGLELYHESSVFSDSSRVPTINSQELLNLYDSTHTILPQNITLVDVREPSEHLDHHLPASINIPMQDLPRWIKKQPEEQLSKIVFYCKSGARSNQATQLARAMTLEAYSLSGGTIEWSEKNYPRVKNAACKPLTF